MRGAAVTGRDGYVTGSTRNSGQPPSAIKAVEDRIIELCEQFAVQEIAFDPYLVKQVQPKILEAGLPAIDFRQVPSLMIPAIADLERAIIGRKLVHGGHPVLRFCFANAEVETNKQGHKIRFSKPRKWLSIDGAIAAAMAISRASQGEATHWLDTGTDADIDALFDDL